MFKEIKELNDERLRLDKNDQANMTKYDPKRALNRLSTYVDEVHDILTTLDIRQIMKKQLKLSPYDPNKKLSDVQTVRPKMVQLMLQTMLQTTMQSMSRSNLPTTTRTMF